MASERRPLPARRTVLLVLGSLVALLAAGTFTPPGRVLRFPPAVWWARRCNRREFERHPGLYRGLAAFVKRDIARLKPGETMMYRLVEGSGGPTLTRLEPGLDDDRLRQLIHEGAVVEVSRFPSEFGVRFVTRPLPGGGELSLIYWDPAPYGSLIWSGTPWCDLLDVDWIDGQWWNAIQPDEVSRFWPPKERAWEKRP